MPSAIGHIAVGASLGYSLYPKEKTLKFWLSVLALSIFPDFDVIMFKFGIEYSHPFGHRGFFHSLTFALIISLLFVIIFFRDKKLLSKDFWLLSGVFFIIVSVHCVLDAMTDGGLGIGLFIPFDNSRYFLPWQPIEVSPIGISQFFSNWGLRVLKNEFMILILPSIILALSVKFVRSKADESPNENK